MHHAFIAQEKEGDFGFLFSKRRVEGRDDDEGIGRCDAGRMQRHDKLGGRGAGGDALGPFEGEAVRVGQRRHEETGVSHESGAAQFGGSLARLARLQRRLGPCGAWGDSALVSGGQGWLEDFLRLGCDHRQLDLFAHHIAQRITGSFQFLRDLDGVGLDFGVKVGGHFSRDDRGKLGIAKGQEEAPQLLRQVKAARDDAGKFEAVFFDERDQIGILQNGRAQKQRGADVGGFFAQAQHQLQRRMRQMRQAGGGHAAGLLAGIGKRCKHQILKLPGLKPRRARARGERVDGSEHDLVLAGLAGGVFQGSEVLRFCILRHDFTHTPHQHG